MIKVKKEGIILSKTQNFSHSITVRAKLILSRNKNNSNRPVYI